MKIPRKHPLLQLYILIFFGLCCDAYQRYIYFALCEYQTTSIIYCHTYNKYTKIMPSARAVPRTLYDKVFQDHIVDERDDSTILLYIDRHLVHEVTSPQAFEGLRNANRRVRRPDCTLATTDHVRKYGSRTLNLYAHSFHRMFQLHHGGISKAPKHSLRKRIHGPSASRWKTM